MLRAIMKQRARASIVQYLDAVDALPEDIDDPTGYFVGKTNIMMFRLLDALSCLSDELREWCQGEQVE
jgi:hypothetical protein